MFVYVIAEILQTDAPPGGTIASLAPSISIYREQGDLPGAITSGHVRRAKEMNGPVWVPRIESFLSYHRVH